MERKKEAGNLGELMTTGICILAMTFVMMAYMDCVDVIQDKLEAGQLARKYILRMETTGYLTMEDREELTGELTALGITEPGYAGSTLEEVLYGEPIELHITGKIKGEYPFEEHRYSTGKH
ncbi:MAG: hypothetical protein J6C84_03710 [Lachnospiraceae bacterium]|nr:hypothetical protein [Lachnospiraceae bacterium]